MSGGTRLNHKENNDDLRPEYDLSQLRGNCLSGEVPEDHAMVRVRIWCA